MGALDHVAWIDDIGCSIGNAGNRFTQAMTVNKRSVGISELPDWPYGQVRMFASPGQPDEFIIF